MRFRTTIRLEGKTATGLSVEDAKTPETRQRRIARSVDLLREGRT